MVKELEGSETIYRFKHPSIRDAFGGVMGDDPNLMDVYLRGARTEVLVDEITCGDVQLQGVRLVVPSDRFMLVIERLRELKLDPEGPRRIASFLSSRCSTEFLETFMHEDPDFLSSLSLRSWLVYTEEAKLFGLLKKTNLLTELYRKHFVEEARDLALYRPEWRFMLRRDIRAIFLPKELHSLRAESRRRLTGRQLQSETDYWKKQWEKSKDKDPDNHFWQWEQELIAFAREFRHNKAVHARFESAQRKLTKLKDKLRKDAEKSQGDLSAAKERSKIKSARSLFDDIDN